MEKPILVTQSSMPPMEEYIQEIAPIWASHWLTNMGEKYDKLQEQLKQYLKVQNLSLVMNGHMALELGIQALGLSGEIITSPYTFASTTHAIVRNGLTPVFCDINPVDFTIDTDKIEELITDKTSAIMPIHVYGNVCNVERIEEIANRNHLKVIYDAAHAFGVQFKDKGIASYGDASMFSFHATKVYNTIEGGAISFRNQNNEILFNRLRNFGIENEEIVDYVGSNAKMNEFQAAMGICNLRHVEEEIQKRKKMVQRYDANLKDIQGIQLSPRQENVKKNYAYYPIVIHEEQTGYSRDEVCERLKAENIFPRKYFYPITNMFKCYPSAYEKYQTPVALRLSRQVLTLPLFAELELEQVDRICDIIKHI